MPGAGCTKFPICRSFAEPFSVSIPQISADGPGTKACSSRLFWGTYGNKPGGGRTCGASESLFRYYSSSFFAMAGSHDRCDCVRAVGGRRVLPISAFPSWIAVDCIRTKHLDFVRDDGHSPTP